MRWITFYSCSLERTIRLNLATVVWATFTGTAEGYIEFHFGAVGDDTYMHRIDTDDWHRLSNVLDMLEDELPLGVPA